MSYGIGIWGLALITNRLPVRHSLGDVAVSFLFNRPLSLASPDLRDGAGRMV
jgi:hypothetical protein